MKLAIVTAYPPSKVTLNEYAFHLVKEFQQKEILTELILLTDKTDGVRSVPYREGGCLITIKECWSFNSYSNIINVTKAIGQTKPDCVLFNIQFMKFGDKKIPAALSLMLPWICKLKKIPTIVLLHNILEQVDLGNAGFTSNKIMQKFYNFVGTLLTRLILKADRVAVTIDKYVDVLKTKYEKDTIICVPHGTFELPEKPNYSVPKNPMKIMTFGKFGTYKKVEGMIEAIEKVRERTGLDLEIVIAGTDNPNVSGYLEEVNKRYAHVSQLTFTGYVKEEDVPRIFQESTVVVFPYTSTTGSSGVLHQSGGYGKAVVMPNISDLASLVKDEGYRGEFFEPNSVASLADAIEKIITDDEYRVELGKMNYKAATAYPMSRIAEIYIEEFKKIIEEKQSSKIKVLE
ncbi:MAG: glycosyltransferase [Flavobacteriaceae bacterium]|nr:glycosyltransferase [Flavobacteriaceae bacterium]